MSEGLQWLVIGVLVAGAAVMAAWRLLPARLWFAMLRALLGMRLAHHLLPTALMQRWMARLDDAALRQGGCSACGSATRSRVHR